MKDYLHYYDVVYTTDKTVFDRAFTADEYSVLDICFDSKSEALTAAEVIKKLLPDVTRIDVNYNIVEYDNEDENYWNCITCTCLADYIKADDGSWPE